MIKVSIDQEDRTIISVCVSNIRVPKYIKLTLTKQNRKYIGQYSRNL